MSTARVSTRWPLQLEPAMALTNSVEARDCTWTFWPKFRSVLHGSSSVPQDEVARINAAGGKLLGAKGVDANQFKHAAELGVTKVNIETDGRLVWTRVHREWFLAHPEDFDLRPVGKVFMAEYAKFIAGKNEKLGSAGHLEEVRKLVA